MGDLVHSHGDTAGQRLIQLDLLKSIPAGQTAIFTITDPAGNAGKGLAVPVTLTGEIDVDPNGDAFYDAVSADIAAQAPAGSNISLITVTNTTVAGSTRRSSRSPGPCPAPPATT